MSQNLRVAIADTFWDRLFDLPKAQQKKVRSFVTKFRQSPTASGINYERINAACQSNYRSVRIDQAYRCIVLAPEKGSVYVLLWVDLHDDAYSWARRTRVEVHPNTGYLQIYSTVDADEDTPTEGGQVPDTLAASSAPSVPERSQKPPSELPSVPLFNLDDTRLLGIGVPKPMVQVVIELYSVDQLERLQNALPTEAYEALYLFANGCEWSEIWDEYGVSDNQVIDVTDIEAAIDRDGSKRRFHLVESDEELQAMLAAPLEKWRVYLHPSQRKLVERDWNGPVRVLGGAGTGKTVVAMHRAVWLVRNRLNNTAGDQTGSGGKVLFLTYNTNLAGDISQQLATITSPEEHAKIEVINIDAWVSRFLKTRRYTSRIVRDGEMDPLWKDVIDASAAPPGRRFPPSFYTEEWDRVILPQRVNSRTEYLKVSRTGRGIALTRPQRAAIWDVFDDIRSEMQHKGWRTYQDAAYDVCDLLDAGGATLPDRHVVVDETQDMGAEMLTLIRRLVPEGQNDLFLVGDGHQRIYRRRAVMSRCGIKIVGRARKLKINYRTTEQIRQFATSVLEGLAIDDLDDGQDKSSDYRSLTTGVDPTFHGAADDSEEIRWIAKEVKALCPDEASRGSCCVMLRTNGLRDRYAKGLVAAGLDVVALEQRADNQAVPGVRVATMHRVKGLEFRHVFLASIGKKYLPNTNAVRDSEDPTEIRDNEISERALLHVASTRAIEHLMISWAGEPSDYLSDYSI